MLAAFGKDARGRLSEETREGLAARAPRAGPFLYLG
jgi:hypothetical protein